MINSILIVAASGDFFTTFFSLDVTLRSRIPPGNAADNSCFVS